MQDVRGGEPVQRDPEGPREPGEDAGDEERHPAVVPDLHAHELGARLIVADRLERLAEGRVHDDPHDGHADHEDREDVEVVPVRQELELVAPGPDEPAEQGGRGHAEAVAAPGHPEELVGEAPQHLRQRHREDAEEDLGVADTEQPEERGHRPRGQDAAQEKGFHGLELEVFDDERHRVGAHAEVRGVAEGQQAGVAQQQVEAERGDRQDQAVGEQHGLVRRHHERQDDQREQDRRRPGEHATRRPRHRLHAIGLMRGPGSPRAGS